MSDTVKSWLTYGVPCTECGRPSRQVNEYPALRVVEHTNMTLPPCRRLPNPPKDGEP